MNTKQLDAQYIAHTYARFPVTLTKGKGALVWDDEGREYIDLGSGIAVTTLGHANDGWKAAVTAQLDRVSHTSNLYFTEPCVQLAQTLCKRTGMNKVFFSNSGAEANECAIKVARKYAATHKGSDYNTIITLVNSFHGRTITTLAATGQDVFHHDFLPLTEGFVYAPAGDLAAVKQLVAEHKCAAIMFELVQGEGGVVPLSHDFVDGLVQIAAENDLLLICDEVQTGNGRTGTLYAYQQYGFMPDIVSTAKGLAAGLPLGATLLSERVEDTLTYGDHGSTFGGNPVCCAAANYVLSQLDETLLADVREKSAYIVGELTGAKGIEAVDGMGLMLGVKTTRPASDVIADCMQNGVLVIKAKDRVRLLPSLNIPFEQLKTAIATLKAACAKEV